MYTSIFGSSWGGTTSPCSLDIRCGSRGGRDCGAILDALGVRSMYSSSSSCFISMYVASTNCSTYWNYTYSPYSSSVWSSVASNCICAFFSVSVPCPSSCSYFFLSSLSLLLRSCFDFSFFPASYNLLSVSSNLFFSLIFRCTLLLCCFLFASISKDTLWRSGSSLNLYLFLASVLSAIFLLPLSYASWLLIVTIVVASSGVAAYSVSFHSTVVLTSSLTLEEL